MAKQFLVLYLTVFVFSANLFLQAGAATDILDALQDLYHALNGPPQLDGRKLDSGDPRVEHWAAVSCSGSSVIHLDLSYNNFSGDLSDSFGSLKNPTKLFLQNNKFSGSVVYLAELPLTDLNIEDNHFSGLIPKQFKSILNLFLNRIWGNSFDAASNYAPWSFPLDNASHLKNEIDPPSNQSNDIEDCLSLEASETNKKRLSPGAISSTMAGVVLVVTGAALLFAIHIKQSGVRRLNGSESTGYRLHSLLNDASGDMSGMVKLVVIILFFQCVNCSTLSHTTVSHYLPPPPLNKADDLVLLVALNGTFFLAEQGQVLYTFASGRQLYTSYHVDTFGPDKYLDFHEGSVYIYSRRYGKQLRLEFTLEELIEKTPYISEDGGMIFGSLTTTVHHFDKFGRVAGNLGNETENHIYIFRRDYNLMSVCPEFSRTCPPEEVIWTIGFAHIESFQCEGWLEMEIGHVESNCKRIMVKHITDHFQNWAPLSLPPVAGTYPRNLLRDLSQYVSVSVLVPFGVLSIIMAGFFCYCIKGTRIEKHHNEASRERQNEGFRNKQMEEASRNEQQDEPLKHKQQDEPLENKQQDEALENKQQDIASKNKQQNEEEEDVIGNGRLHVFRKRIIALGSNSNIYEGTYNRQGAAVKRLDREHTELVDKEIDFLIESRHENVLQYYGVETDRYFVYIALELCICNLDDLIRAPASKAKGIQFWKKNESNRPTIHLLKLMKDIARGLSHLHENGIIHRDLKPSNILITKGLSAKLGDMGISKKLSKNKSSITRTDTVYGTTGWQAAEVLNKERQTKSLDVFALGCVFFYCLTQGRQPYGTDVNKCAERIKKNKPDLFLLVKQPESHDLVSRILVLKPDNRPTAKQVKKHPLFWKAWKRLEFLGDASDKVEEAGKNNDMALLTALESCLALKKKRWNKNLDRGFVQEMCQYRAYKFTSVRDLLRIIRNAKSHYFELSLHSQAILGASKQEQDAYFTSRFPVLLFKVYDLLVYKSKGGPGLINKYKWL